MKNHDPRQSCSSPAQEQDVFESLFHRDMVAVIQVVLDPRETAYQTIRSRIITMELKPGDPLNDRELAEELVISRTPMREALLMLNLARKMCIRDSL